MNYSEEDLLALIERHDDNEEFYRSKLKELHQEGISGAQLSAILALVDAQTRTAAAIEDLHRSLLAGDALVRVNND